MFILFEQYLDVIILIHLHEVNIEQLQDGFFGHK